MAVSHTDRKYYLSRRVSEPRNKWLILTGLTDSASTDDLLEAFKPVVSKLLITDRPGFRGWFGQNLANPTPQQQALLEQQLQNKQYEVDYGTAVVTFDEQAKQPRIEVDYLVYSDEPIFTVQQPPAMPAVSAWAPWTAAIIAGVGVGALVNAKHPGMRFFAAGSAALLGAVLTRNYVSET